MVKGEIEFELKEAEEKIAKAGILLSMDPETFIKEIYNRIFLALEHACNALVLRFYGGYSTRHFGDIKKYREIEKRFEDLKGLSDLYEELFYKRMYSDYGKHKDKIVKFSVPDCIEKFNKVKKIIEDIKRIIGSKI